MKKQHISMRTEKNISIIAMTTDPYNNIYGYALVFLRLFDYIEKKHRNIHITLFSNGGVSSSLVKNKQFQIVRVNRSSNLIVKTITLVYKFTSKIRTSDKSTIIIANCEIPELIAAALLKRKFRNVYCVIQDDRVRTNSYFTKFVCALRLYLVKRIGNVLFTNKYTMSRFNDSVNKVYIGNPVF